MQNRKSLKIHLLGRKTQNAKRKTQNAKRKTHNATKGMTLIEMIAVIVVVSIAIPPLLTMWADVGRRSVQSESVADASYYAQALMEEVRSKRFDEDIDSPWTSTGSFGTDPSEDSNDKDTFDDVDDFVGCTDTQVTTPATGYVRSVAVDYVMLNGSTWESCGSVTCVSFTDCTTCQDCCYKRITVSVSRTGLTDAVTLTTMRSAY